METEKQRWIAELKTGGVKKLQEYGLSNDDLSSQLLGIETPVAPEEQLRKQIADLQARIDAKEAAEKKASNDKLVSDYRSDVFSALEKEGDKYEMILQAPGGKDLYWESVLQYYRKYEVAPDLHELAEGVETQLFEHNKQLLGLKKLTPKTPAAEPAKVAPSESASTFKTLSSRMTANTTPKIKMVERNTASVLGSEYSNYMNAAQERIKQRLK